MGSRRTFAILCVVQIVIGFLIFSFGIVDRAGIEVQWSFLMLPIWIGVLAGIVGVYGLLIGRQNSRQGFPDIDAASGIRAINIICVGLSFLAFSMYGYVLSYMGLRDAYDWHQQWDYPVVVTMATLPAGVFQDSSTIQGILSVIMVLSVAEMFVGCWLAIIDKNQMFCGSSLQQSLSLYNPNGICQSVYQQQPVQQTAPMVSQVSSQPQQQQRYVVPQGNIPSSQGYVHTNQLPQQYVMMNAPQLAPAVMVIPSNQNMVPRHQYMAIGQQSMVPSNQNVVLGNRNVAPINTMHNDHNVVVSNHSDHNVVVSNQSDHNVVVRNQNRVPSNKDPTTTHPNHGFKAPAQHQSKETEAGVSGINEHDIEKQENEWTSMDSDRNKLI